VGERGIAWRIDVEVKVRWDYMMSNKTLSDHELTGMSVRSVKLNIL
jgi:hypothetical protein